MYSIEQERVLCLDQRTTLEKLWNILPSISTYQNWTKLLSVTLQIYSDSAKEKHMVKADGGLFNTEMDALVGAEVCKLISNSTNCLKDLFSRSVFSIL